MSERDGGPGEDEEPRTLGVLGTLVRDTIHRPGDPEPIREWGGISYSLSAFEAEGPPGWAVLPIVKVGRDVRGHARRLLRSYPSVASLEGVRFVPETNNRVELRYADGERRSERLRGGVPGWRWSELGPLVDGCDALYVNFIAGWELDLETAGRLRRGFDGPLYADLHSLLLDVGADGFRRPRPLGRGREWVRCFDYVQMNREELETLASGAGEDPWAFAASVAGRETRAVFVTLGADGAAWVAGPGSSGRRAAEDEVRSPDATGCGDAWGMGCFSALLEGASPSEAAARGNRVAARNAAVRGGTGLVRGR